MINEENGQVCRNPDIAPAYKALGLTGCPLSQFSAPYLAKVLPAEGTLVENYFGIGHESLDNYIAEVSGQAPNPDTQADCPGPGDLTPGTADGPQQQAIGQGCYFPARVKTIADQLQGRGLTWKGYEEDMGRDQAKDATRPAATGPGRSPDRAPTALSPTPKPALMPTSPNTTRLSGFTRSPTTPLRAMRTSCRSPGSAPTSSGSTPLRTSHS